MNFTNAESGQICILHVEDSDADAKLINITLGQAIRDNYSLHRTVNIDESLKYLQCNKVELILLDLYLPDSQGLDTLRRIRTLHPKNAIVVITGSNDEDTALMAVQNGAQDYLVKDELTPSVISRAIRYSIERHKYDQQMIELANIDMLTGLPNRSNFMEYLHQAIHNTQRLHHTLSLLFIDCDHFKLINDTLGHVKGDEFLVRLASSLKDTVRTSDFVARLAGDEFIIVFLAKANSTPSPLMFAEKIINIVRYGIRLSSGEVLDARCSIGITSYDGKGEIPTPDKLIHEADSAMYLSKKRGGDCISFFDQDLEEKAERRLRLLRDITSAFRDKEFFLHYQPIVNTSKNTYTGFETLLRWKNKRGENIPPQDFIPLIEENGMIHSIGNWIIRQACTDFMLIQKSGLLTETSWLSINISPIQLQNKSFLNDLRKIIEDSNIPPVSLVLEITENLLMEKSEYILSVLEGIKDIGCRLAIDDFGVGYSSMSYLKNLPIDILKIDKSFILSCCKNKQDTAITKAMISLAHNLDMEVIAEGVEHNEASHFLTKQQCEYLQGFYFSKPQGFDALKKCLTDDLVSLNQKNSQ